MSLTQLTDSILSQAEVAEMTPAYWPGLAGKGGFKLDPSFWNLGQPKKPYLILAEAEVWSERVHRQDFPKAESKVIVGTLLSPGVEYLTEIVR
jgi:hypothetical protein